MGCASDMAKNLEISVLLDFYGDMLTEKQKEVVELYYNADLSLAEIASHEQITRQGVRDSIKRAEMQLLDFEARLGLAKRFRKIQDGLDQITQLAGNIRQMSNMAELREDAAAIIQLASTLNEEE